MGNDALSALNGTFARLGIVWTVIGAVAANRYRREVRLTGDIDLLLDGHGAGGLGALEAALRNEGWSVLRADPEGALLRLRHAELGVVDLVVAETDYQHLAIERAREESLDGAARVRLLQLEDVLVHKLIAGRSRDLADIEDILAAAPTFDDGYIETWAAAFGVEERWRRLRTRVPD